MNALDDLLSRTFLGVRIMMVPVLDGVEALAIGGDEHDVDQDATEEEEAFEGHLAVDFGHLGNEPRDKLVHLGLVEGKVGGSVVGTVGTLARNMALGLARTRYRYEMTTLKLCERCVYSQESHGWIYEE